jgi:putative transposase
MMPFESSAWVLLPDHLHTIWQLPENDGNYSLRWSLIKQEVTRRCGGADNVQLTGSRRRRREGMIWQRRFWEHTIRDDTDFRNHIDYIHFNPVKHGYVKRPSDWPYSTFHRFVQERIYPEDWAWSDNNSSSYGE